MSGNSDPIYSRVGSISAVGITAANTSSQGGGTIGTDIFLAFTADATNGSFIREIRFTPTASAAATATNSTTARIFVSSVTSGSTTSSNTHLIQEVALGAQTADQTTSAVFSVVVPLNFALPPGWTILVTNHVAPATNSAWKAVVIGGNY
jgi:hypothetical protein